MDEQLSPERMHQVQKKSWSELRDIVIQSRKACAAGAKVPNSFTFCITQSGGQPSTVRLYYIGAPSASSENTLMYIDISVFGSGEIFAGKCLLNSFVATPHHGLYTKEEQLQRERKRVVQYGITSYDFSNTNRTFIFPACNSLYVVSDVDEETAGFCKILDAQEVVQECPGARLDPKLCPSNDSLLAYVSNNDLWATCLLSGHTVRLTYAHKGGCDLATDCLSAGVAPFIMQEEFDRFTGYWWQPISSVENGMTIYRILFEEVDESDVAILKIVSSDGSDSVDEYRYPRAGTSNARSDLKIVEFALNADSEIINVKVRHLQQPLLTSLAWAEYIARAGWTPDGNYVHMQLIDRCQQRLELVVVPLQCFTVLDDRKIEGTDQRGFSLIGLSHWVLCQELSNSWVNVSDILHFFPFNISTRQMSFIWSSERSGYRHLYLTTVAVGAEVTGPAPVSCTQVACTSGNWEVDSKQVWVDEEHRYIYFIAYKDTPLESHLYSVHLDRPGVVVRLTELGYSHSVTMSEDCSMFVSTYSSIKMPHRAAVFTIVHSPDTFTVQHIGTLPECNPSANDNSPAALMRFTDPQLFEFESLSGPTMYGMIYEPSDRQPGVLYPIVLFVYGGPHVQLVNQNYKGAKFMRLQLLAKLGYAVVVIDNRGSSHRGLDFESHLYKRMGMVELEDQIEGLEYIASKLDYLDLNRVAIHGWSYGGYLSLMGLAQWSHVFKLAIAGAPVTCWKLYDTGYTERYMGLPEDNDSGYKEGSVLHYVNSFPREPNRLLIAHGLMDENVHFQHTSTLIHALVRAGVPYGLLVYPRERHGLRSVESSEHFETSMLHFLQSYL